MIETTEMPLMVELRFASDPERSSPGVISGVLMRYGSRARSRSERFAANALSWPETGVVLNDSHDRRAPIMRITPELDGDSVIINAPLPDTARGRDAATGIRDGLYRGLSVEFRALAERREGLERVITRAELLGAGLVTEPDYATSVEVRGQLAAREGVLPWL